ncbi:Trafficking protein particle complex subunit 10 [Metarhizium album ARSEF 1941]|uniref:Trafficking protein particle complex subunit 10 n=1 Tax=Metarhizium album (strain ARSEF 1941) TaxID=1081103 RepID=A0A0B2WWH3_METAS|nr:Trafficking protein particle complex subunit 10 [Metarhizium album ARSEF 1941]KHN97964.1 Trafficking protein particle complex subunit 10 [Metarhizium album ARSEF 1941]
MIRCQRQDRGVGHGTAVIDVKIEFFDPHHVYKLLAPGLAPRLPLHNLHWQSHAGPLRSIDTLHVDLVPGDASESAESGPAKSRRSTNASHDDGFQTQQVGGQTGSTETVDKQPASTKSSSSGQRRHQIPGLRSTPYLKVLLVRCDDNDSYKAAVRTEIREWIKVHTPPSSSSKKASKQEKHDAFEWLILHVVLPNTTAATQPRNTGSKGEGGSSEKSSTTSLWRSGSTPLMEKLRSDFNSSSKGAPDRVAQIRIGINDVPYDSLPRVVPAVPSGYSETEQDAENAWNDLMSKFKRLILSSFDMRVTQYEEDIKEKDGQRSLPGWNFCTFFILKEGLARGFENVGLVEDALVGYDELGVGLDAVIKEQAESGAPEQHGGAMLSYTEEVKRAARRAWTELSGDAGDEEAVDLQKQEAASNDADEIPISSSKKAYRDMILANKVSVFDFRCYIFSRQISLLLRLGNASATREELLAKLMDQRDSILHGVAPPMPPMNNDDGLENLGMLSEVCRRTLKFIPVISQVMREDITASLLDASNSNMPDKAPVTTLDPLLLEVMDNMAASFSFTIAQQVLAQTSTKSLPIPPPTLAKGDGAEPKASIPEPKTMLHPARSSSLHTQPSPRPPPSPSFPGPGRQVSLAEPESHASSFLKVGLEELAARRAELYMLSRGILEGLGKKRGWSNGWDEAPLVGEPGAGGLEEVSLDDDAGDGGLNIGPKPSTQSTARSVAGIESQILRTANDNTVDFYHLYEILTDKANHHFAVANHVHAVKACTADLAMLKVHLKEYKAATSYFEQTTPFFAEKGWSLLELSLLVMYCQCLSELGSNDHYVNVAMTLLIKSCAAERERREQKSGVAAPPKTSILENSPIKQVAAKLFALTSNLSTEVKVPLSNFFMDVELEGTPLYHDRKDGCSLKIQLRSLLPEKLTMESAKLRITCTDGGPRKDINFEVGGDIVLAPGKSSFSVACNSVIPGSYRVSRLALTASNLFLYHEQDVNSLPPRTSNIFRDPDVTLFQRTNALDVQLTASKHISLGKNNALDLTICSGWNMLQSCDVKIRPTTGGLRLLTTEARFVDEIIKFARPPESGVLFFGPIEEETSITVRFPYSIEQDLGDVSVKADVTYVTEDGESFQLAKSIMIPVSLALGVNVQDVFKHNALFSRFNVDTASSSPLRLFKSELLGSELFEPSFGIPPASPVMIFPKQHATLLYRVRRKEGVAVAARSDRIMHLKLYYSVLQTEIEARIQESILEGLRDTPLELYSRVTAARVLEATRNGLQAHDLERAALVGEVTTSYLEKVQWGHDLRGLGCVPGTSEDAATKLAEFLHDWQRRHPRMTMPTCTPDDPWSIVIPVEVPSLPVVHTADIRISQCLVDRLEGRSAGAPAASVNQVLRATLHLKWTRIWDTEALGRDDEEFSYEVAAPSDAWLIGGRRSGHFVIPGGKRPSAMSSTAETEAEIPLVLIPQREGYLPYPTVDIKSVPPTAGLGGAASTAAPPCEVDWRNLGETVRVVNERRSVTVSLDASGPGGGPLVCESEGVNRQEGRIVA